MAIGYTYITEIQTKRRVLYYGGKKLSAQFKPNYLGSGRVVKLLKSKIKEKMFVRLHSWHNSIEEMNIAERELIATLRALHGKHCVNVNDGGDGFSAEMSARIENTPSLKKKRVDGIKKAWESPERRKKAAETSRIALLEPVRRNSFIAASHTKEAIAKARKTHQSMWADPGHRAKRVASLTTDERCEAVSIGQTKAWKDPEIRARRSRALAEKHEDKEFVARRNEALRAVATKPEYRAMRKDVATRLWSDPEYKARRVEQLKRVVNTPEAIAKRSAAIKAAWARRKGLPI